MIGSRDGDDLVTVYTGVDLTPAGSQFPLNNENYQNYG